MAASTARPALLQDAIAGVDGVRIGGRDHPALRGDGLLVRPAGRVLGRGLLLRQRERRHDQCGTQEAAPHDGIVRGQVRIPSISTACDMDCKSRGLHLTANALASGRLRHDCARRRHHCRSHGPSHPGIPSKSTLSVEHRGAPEHNPSLRWGGRSDTVVHMLAGGSDAPVRFRSTAADASRPRFARARTGGHGWPGCCEPARLTPASVRRSSSTTRRCATTSSPPTRKRRPRSTPAPTSRAGSAPAASSRSSPIRRRVWQAVCRFFGTPGKGLNSHFYTADAAECAKVKTLPAWTFEAIAFYIPTPRQRRLRRQLAGVPQLLHRQHRRRQPPLHGRPDGARADAAAARRRARRHRDVRAGDRARSARRTSCASSSRRRWGRPKRWSQEVKAKGIAAVARRAAGDERHAVHAVSVLGTAEDNDAVQGRQDAAGHAGEVLRTPTMGVRAGRRGNSSASRRRRRTSFACAWRTSGTRSS